MACKQVCGWGRSLDEVCADAKVPEGLLHIDPVEHCHAGIVLINDVAEHVCGVFDVDSTETLRHVQDALYSGLMESVVQAAGHISERRAVSVGALKPA